MSGLFLKVFNRSVSAGWFILAVVLVRFIFKKAPKWFNCLLWALVAVRLICPFSIESSFSLLPDEEFENTYLGERFYEGGDVPVKDSVKALKSVTAPFRMITIIWLTGIFSFLIYALISYLYLQRRVSESVRLQLVKDLFIIFHHFFMVCPVFHALNHGE